ncbi:hypothetical protein D3C85_1073490 [compost metagenome]
MAELDQLIDCLAGAIHVGGQLLDRLGGARNHSDAIVGFQVGADRRLGSGLCVARDLLGSGRHFLHGSGQLVEFLQLLLQTTGGQLGFAGGQRGASTHPL